MKKVYIFLTCLIMLFACKEEASKPKFSECNSKLGACKGSQKGEYCLFGFKWGEKQQFSPAGIEVGGPKLPGGTLTYSFHTEIKIVSNHLTDALETISFDEKGSCAREKAQQALSDWEKHGDFSFLQVEDNSLSDIQFIVVEDSDVNTGSPNYQDALCSELRGKIIFTSKRIQNCDEFYILCLHEIGHVLGLGHVDSENVMSQGSKKYNYDGLQQGDIQGVIEIYGEK